MWDTSSGELIAGPLEGHSRPTRSVAFCPYGSKSVSSSDDCTIRVWDANAVTIVINEASTQGHSKSITAVALSSDGERIASSSHDCTILIWGMKSGRIEVGPLVGHADSAMSIAFSPDGNLIASGSDDYNILVWDAYQGTVIAGPCIGHILSVKSVAFSPSGVLIASGSDDCTIRVWDVSGIQVAGPLIEYPDHRVVAFSTCGSHIISSSADHTLQIWDLDSGNIIGKPQKQGMYEEHSAAIAFSVDGTKLAYGVDNYSIKVTDTRTGAPVGGPCAGHTSTVMSVALSADGSRVISGSSDGTIRVWHLNQPTNAPLIMRSSWCMNDNGWIIANNVTLYWVPPDLHNRAPRFPGTLTLGPEGTSVFRIDRWDLLGEGWTRCYTSE